MKLYPTGVIVSIAMFSHKMLGKKFMTSLIF
jgi:hypothetical protein